MYRTAVAIALLLFSTALVGCHTDTPKASPAPITQKPASATTAPSPQDCAALTDPAQAEDCRFRAEVLRKRKESKATPVVKHSPGTIQQP